MWTNSPTSKPSRFAPYDAVWTVCWPGPATTSCNRMMPKSLYGRRRVAGLPYPSLHQEVVRVLAAVREHLRDAHVLQHLPRRAVVAGHFHEVRALAVRGRRLHVRIDAPDRRAILHAHRDDHGVRDRERAGDLERVRAAVARPVARHERLAVVAQRERRERPVAEVVRHARDRRDHADGGDLALDPRRESRRPEESLLDAERERLRVELEEPDARCVRAPQRFERWQSSGRGSSSQCRWNWKLPVGTTSPVLPGPTICAHSYERRYPMSGSFASSLNTTKSPTRNTRAVAGFTVQATVTGSVSLSMAASRLAHRSTASSST